MGNEFCSACQEPARAPSEHDPAGTLPHPAHRRTDVFQIFQDFPAALRGSMFRGTTTRYSDLSVLHEDYNRYIFVMRGEGQREIRVVVPVLNELSHRALHPNYKLNIGKEVIVDPFDDRFASSLLPVRNETTGKEYSMRIVPFRSYNSLEFKRTLQQIWLYQSIQRQSDNKSKGGQDPRSLFLWLEDYYFYGVNPDQQAVVLLYERTAGSLLLAAEYRLRGDWPWSLQDRFRILRDLLLACLRLQQSGMVHRDIRPSNLFFLQKQRRFVLGGLACARQFRKAEQDLLTVNGLQGLSEGHLKELVSQRENMGIYRAQQTTYSGLKAVNRLLETLRVTEEQGACRFASREFSSVQELLGREASLGAVLGVLEGGVRGEQGLGEEGGVLRQAGKVVPGWYRQRCQQFQFEAYAALGYQLEFSEMAHGVIERNNIEGRPFANATILRDLGLFYEKYGTGGSEYLLNSCVLYCREADMEIERGLFDDADHHLEQGEDIYIKLSSLGDFQLTMIELKRLRAELRARTLWRVGSDGQEREKKDIMELMGKTLQMAGEVNLPVEKQMRMFLTWGVVLRECGDVKTAEQRFRNGLAVCENTGAFESQSSVSLSRSHFLYELGLLQLSAMHQQHDPLVGLQGQRYVPSDLPRAIETGLQESLELRQRESTRPYQVAQCSLALGDLYMLQSEYLQANVQLKRSLIQLEDIQKREKLPAETLVQLHYDLGSVNYRLQDYGESAEHYREALRLMEQDPGDKYWNSVISGNLGLAYLRVGQREEGRKLLQRAKEVIRSQQGASHYDYQFLTAQEELIGLKA